MMKIEQSLEGRKIKIVYLDGEVLTGKVLDYIYPEDNEPEGVAGLTVDCPQRDYLLGINENEIESIEVIE